jgi:predicted ATPase
MLTKLTLEGFKSFRKLELELRPLNVLIGANGAGKSNLVSAFQFAYELVGGRLQHSIGQAGGSDAFLRYGKKTTKHILLKFEFGELIYEAKLQPNAEDSLFFAQEKISYPETNSEGVVTRIEMTPGAAVEIFPRAAGHVESGFLLKFFKDENMQRLKAVMPLVANIRTYHIPDTSSTASIKGTGRINDNLGLRSDAENLAAMLYLIRTQNLKAYQTICDVIRSVAPYFDDFQLRPNPLNPDTIRLEWREQDSDYPFLAKDLSDGTLRFMALVTLLLQPNPPAITVIDEPELGLHPFAIEKLAGLLQIASSRTQLIVATQNPQLIAALEPEDVIVADRENGETTLRRLDATALEGWLEEYTLGELWQKNILGGVVNPNPVPSRGNS